MTGITFSLENDLDPVEFKDVLIRSGLDERRPAEHPEKLEAMCQHANLTITARRDGLLVGIARSLSDFSWCTYLSDLAVDRDYQSLGIGRKLIDETVAHSNGGLVLLLAAPGKSTYYEHVGMSKFTECFLHRRPQS